MLSSSAIFDVAVVVGDRCDIVSRASVTTGRLFAVRNFGTNGPFDSEN